jgi:Protein of unknown function (DUF2585)
MSLRTFLAFVGILLALHIGSLILLRQPIICTCGYVKLWHGNVLSAGNSQHITEWYTFSHIIHGFCFYLLMWFLFPRIPITQRFLLSLGIETGWEILENTLWLIQMYRKQALAVGYSGDSVINSVFDSVAMALGFVLAWRLPVWITIVLAVAMESFVGYFIHDNLALNILNSVHQFDFIREWQNKIR